MQNHNIFHLQGVLQGPPPLQWVYSIPAFCRGQGRCRAPAVQTLYSLDATVDRCRKISTHFIFASLESLIINTSAFVKDRSSHFFLFGLVQKLIIRGESSPFISDDFP